MNFPSFFLNGPTPASFCLFSIFSNKQYNFTTNICEKCPCSIRCRDSNPQPSEHESLPITTRPGLPSNKKDFLASIVLCTQISVFVTLWPQKGFLVGIGLIENFLMQTFKLNYFKNYTPSKVILKVTSVFSKTSQTIPIQANKNLATSGFEPRTLEATFLATVTAIAALSAQIHFSNSHVTWNIQSDQSAVFQPCRAPV